MFLLALDTCLGCCSAAIYDLQRNVVVVERHEAMERGHAEVLPVMVETCLKVAEISPRSIAKIAVTIGPGTFTGLRIGLSFARGFAAAWQTPIVALTSLEATAAPLFDGGADIAVLHHAGGTGQVFHQRFSGTGEALSDIILVAPNAAPTPAPRNIGTAAGGALPIAHLFAAYASKLQNTRIAEPLYLRPADVKPSKQTVQPVADLVILSVSEEAVTLLYELHKSSFDHPWTEQSFRELFSVPGTYAFIAQSKDTPCGLVIARQALDEAEILTIGTLPRLRGRGVAKALLAQAEARLRANNCKSLFLEVADDNDTARGLYEHAGFAVIGSRKNYYVRGKTQVDAIVMQKSLR